MRDEDKSKEQLIKEIKSLRHEFKDKFEESLRREIINETFPDIFFLIKDDFTILDYKTGNDEKLYLKPELYLGKKINDVMPPEVTKLFVNKINLTLKTKNNQNAEYSLNINEKIQYFDARLIFFSYNKVAIFVRDVSELKYFQRAYKESSTNYEEFVNNMPQTAFQTDINGNLIYISNVGYDYFGYNKEDNILGENLINFIAPQDRKKAIENVKRRMMGDEDVKFDYLGLKKDGTIIPVEIYSSIVRKDEKIVGIQGIIIDLTQRREIEEKIKKSEKRYRDLTELLPLGVFESDGEVNITFMNINGFDLTGYTEKEVYNDLKITDLVIKEERDRLKKNYYNGLFTGKIKSDNYTGLKKDGTTYFVRVIINPIFIDKKPVGFRGILLDITDQKKSEEKLIEAQKMDSIGNLAAGVAHDFNNMLSGIMGYASLLLIDERDEEYRSHIAGILNAAKKSSDLTKKLLAFGRRGKNITQNIDINDTSRRTIEILKRTASKSVKLELELEKNLNLIKADPSQMTQVLMNLCVNALESMENGGTLKITTKNITIDEDYKTYDDIKKGEYIQLTVSDTGSGISDEVQLHIYEPFFTTKKDGQIKGTGLGLAIVYGIVKNHGGIIDYETKLENGTKFIILLPKTDDSPVKKVNPGEIEDSSVKKGFTGKILIVEDEKTVRFMLEKMVKRLGYSFISAKDGREGVDLYKKHNKNIDIIILDMKMPNLDGKGAYIEMKKIDPNLKVILMTGYGHNEEAQEILDLGANTLVLKPYSIKKLRETLNSIHNLT